MKPFRLLVTKKLYRLSAEQTVSGDVVITETEFIAVNPVETEAISLDIKSVLEENYTVIFTSKNAVTAVASIINDLNPELKIFCTNGITRELVINHFGKETIVDTGKDATELAGKIFNSGHKHLVFFCGNKRRDELPEILSAKGIQIREIIVYETKLTPVKIKEDFNGICFFSPSAVESFFSVNEIERSIPCFSIGETTTASLKKFSDNNIFTANNSSEGSMLELVNSYVKNNNGKIEE